MTSEALLIDRRNEVRWYPMRVASAPDDSVSVMAWNDDFFGKPGTKVRITDGDFKGVEGVIRRIKQNKRVVVELQGIAVAAIAFILPAFLEPLENR